MEALKLWNELEVECLQQQQWELALKKLQSTREIMVQQHEENMNKIRDMAEEAQEKAASANQAVAWMQGQLYKDKPQQTPTEEEVHKARLLADLKKQQEEIKRQMDDITGTRTCPSTEPTQGLQQGPTGNRKSEQELLMEQLSVRLYT